MPEITAAVAATNVGADFIGALAEAVCGPGAERGALLDRLRRRPTLLVIDNFEQIDAGGAATIRRLLEQVPELVCLITSRRLLDIEGERDFPVSPLSTPTVSDSSEALSRCPSVQLFLDRAQRGQAGECQGRGIDVGQGFRLAGDDRPPSGFPTRVAIPWWAVPTLRPLSPSPLAGEG